MTSGGELAYMSRHSKGNVLRRSPLDLPLQRAHVTAPARGPHTGRPTPRGGGHDPGPGPAGAARPNVI